jgi:hypothetical protein
MNSSKFLDFPESQLCICEILILKRAVDCFSLELSCLPLPSLSSQSHQMEESATLFFRLKPASPSYSFYPIHMELIKSVL